MIRNNRITGFLLLLGAVLLLAACGKKKAKMIPDQDMRVIMREAMISQAVAQYNNDPSLRPVDSLDLHTSILQKYGYTLDDFQYTVREMSMRKSNPMGSILQQVTDDMRVESEGAKTRFRTKQQIDSIVVARTADTVYRNDTVISGKLDGARFVYSGSDVFRDSIVQPGTYWIRFDYSTGPRAQSYSKSLRYRRIPLTEGAAQGSEVTLWLQPAADTTLFKGELLVRDGIKRLDFAFRESTPRTGTLPDTSYVTNIRLIRVLPAAQAREVYFQQQTGLKPLEELYYERYLESLQESGSPVSPDLGR